MDLAGWISTAINIILLGSLLGGKKWIEAGVEKSVNISSTRASSPPKVISAQRRQKSRPFAMWFLAEEHKERPCSTSGRSRPWNGYGPQQIG